MKKSCSFCGGIHDINYECPSRPKKSYHYNDNPEVRQFRNSKAWKMKRAEIKERDLFMCQICIRELKGTIYKYTFDQLSVHHIHKVVDEPDLKLDNYNLLTTCSIHHEMCENNEIPMKIQLQIAEEQEAKQI